MISRSRSLLLASALLVGVAGNASADVIYNNFGGSLPPFTSPDAFDASIGTIPLITASQAIAVSFTPSADYLFDRATIAVGWIGSGANAFKISITSSSGGQPGTILESFLLSLPESFDGANYHEFNAPTVNSTLHPLLQSGEKYWVIADIDSVAATDQNGAGYPTTSAIPTVFVFRSGAQWFTYPFPLAAEVEGTPAEVATPLPSIASMGMAFCSLFAGAYLLHRRRRAAIPVVA